MAAYGFNEGTGTAVADASGSGNGGHHQRRHVVAGGPFRQRRSTFDGVNDSVTVADSASLDLTTGMTLEAWVNPSRSARRWRTVLLKEQPGGLAYALYSNDNARRPPGYDHHTSEQIGEASGDGRHCRSTRGRTWR